MIVISFFKQDVQKNFVWVFIYVFIEMMTKFGTQVMLQFIRAHQHFYTLAVLYRFIVSCTTHMHSELMG